MGIFDKLNGDQKGNVESETAEKESPDESKDNKSYIEVGVSVYSDSELSGWLSNVSSSIAKQQESNKHTGVISESYTEFIYEYDNIKKVWVGDDGLYFNGVQLKFSDILNTRYLTDKDVVADSESSVLCNCDYISLTVAKDGNVSEKVADYEGNVFYLYLVGPPEKMERYSVRAFESDDEYRVKNNVSTSSAELEELFRKIKDKVPTMSSESYILQDYIERSSHLKVEGWRESGDKRISAGIDGDINTKGKSKGIQVGPFTSSRSKSEGAIVAELDGNIADDSFSSEIAFLQISENGIFIDSDPTLNLNYGAINRVLKRDEGFTIETDGTTYTIVGPRQTASMLLGKSGTFSALNSPDLEEGIAYIQKKIDQTENSDKNRDNEERSLSSKIKELKSLHEEGILTDKEFQSKKEELLDDF